MKIHFALGQPDSPFPIKGDVWKVIRSNKTITRSFDREQISLIKAIEQNIHFNHVIKRIRKDLELPDKGYKIELYRKLRMNIVVRDAFGGIPNKELDDYKVQFKDESLSNMKKEIFEQYETDNYIKNQFNHIVYANCVFPHSRKIHIGKVNKSLSFESNPVEEIGIYISKNVSVNELLKFIRDHKPEIDSLLSTLASPDKYYISAKNMRVYELKKKKYKNREIPDIIVKELNIDDRDGKNNPASLTMAYGRVRDTISSTFKKVTKG